MRTHKLRSCTQESSIKAEQIKKNKGSSILQQKKDEPFVFTRVMSVEAWLETQVGPGVAYPKGQEHA
jgi:hypothetical protein